MQIVSRFDYEEHFVAFIDFLGFADAIDSADEDARTKLLTLLVALSKVQSEFLVETRATPDGTATEVAPNITTFSDNIVISYPLEKLRAKGYYSDTETPAFILDGFSKLLSWLAIAALRLGFLIRGGATIGKLFHSGGVVYGEGMVEAYRIESGISVYPRVVLSANVIARQNWAQSPRILTDTDGLKHVDYFKDLFLSPVETPQGRSPSPKQLFDDACGTISSSLERLRSAKNQRAYAKWVWFSHQLSESILRQNPAVRRQYGFRKDMLPLE
jgi:hypothetical protein